MSAEAQVPPCPRCGGTGSWTCQRVTVTVVKCDCGGTPEMKVTEVH